MESNYVRAGNSNLPEIDAFMVALFFKNNAVYYAAELKNVKTAVQVPTTRSARESYGDDAVGYVQLKRDNGICTVKCIMCPEHKVRTKPYNVTLAINENEREIVSCECHDCAALAGGCKHAVAFLMWVHRRSEDPSSTSIECYWKKPTLSRVGTTIKFLTFDQMTKNPVPHLPSTSAVYDEFIVEANNCELLKYQEDFEHTGVMKFSVHHYLISQPNDIKNDVVMLLEAMKSELSWEIIKSIEKATRQQNKSNLWYEMRYGCIRASKAHEVMTAMKRGKNLEFSVRKTKSKIEIKKKPADFIKVMPIIGASPDGLTKDAVIEIKCPSKAKSKGYYIKKDGVFLQNVKRRCNCKYMPRVCKNVIFV